MSKSAQNSPQVVHSSAPGRICLWGDHQDYLGLPVIACAIDRCLNLSAYQSDEPSLSITHSDLKGTDREHVVIYIDPERDHTDGTCTKNGDGGIDFLRLALIVLQRYGCVPDVGYRIVITGDIPINAGLSSSSALTVAWIQFLLCAFGMPDGGEESILRGATYIDKATLARLAWETEVRELGTSGGKMDHYSICLGKMIFLDTRTNEWQYMQMPAGMRLCVGVSGQAKDTNGTLSHLKLNQLAALSEVKHKHPSFDAYELLDTKPVLQVGQEANPAAIARHTADHEADINTLLPSVTTQHLRPFLHAALTNHFITRSAVNVLTLLPSLSAAGNDSSAAEVQQQQRQCEEQLGRLMSQHHHSLRHDLGNTTDRIDAMVEGAVDAGALGAKIVGSGGGGCVVALVPATADAAAVEAAMKDVCLPGVVDAFTVQTISDGPTLTVSEDRVSDSSGLAAVKRERGGQEKKTTA